MGERRGSTRQNFRITTRQSFRTSHRARLCGPRGHRCGLVVAESPPLATKRFAPSLSSSSVPNPGFQHRPRRGRPAAPPVLNRFSSPHRVWRRSPDSIPAASPRRAAVLTDQGTRHPSVVATPGTWLLSVAALTSDAPVGIVSGGRDAGATGTSDVAAFGPTSPCQPPLGRTFRSSTGRGVDFLGFAVFVTR